MSMMYCEDGCGRLVDTDDEPEAFCKVRRNDGKLHEVCLCTWCRESYPESAIFDLDGRAYYG